MHGHECWRAQPVSSSICKYEVKQKDLEFTFRCLRPYHVEHTRSRLITEVKQRRARIVLGWGTAWEHLVP